MSTDKKVISVDGDLRKRTALLGQEDDIHLERLRVVEAGAPVEGMIPPDASLPPGQFDKRVADNEHISQKLYFFPPEFIALRQELDSHWREWFETVQPLTGTSPAWCMVFDAPQFIGYCNGATGLGIQLDTGNVAGICKKFLNAFRAMRGVGAIE